MELLLKKMCEKTFEIANARQAKTVNTSHMWVEMLGHLLLLGWQSHSTRV